MVSQESSEPLSKDQKNAARARKMRIPNDVLRRELKNVLLYGTILQRNKDAGQIGVEGLEFFVNVEIERAVTAIAKAGQGEPQ